MTGTHRDLEMLLSNYAAPAGALGWQLGLGSLALNLETPTWASKRTKTFFAGMVKVQIEKLRLRGLAFP